MEPLELTMFLHGESRNSTASMLYVDGELHCCVIEDGYREAKVSGETRIPAGRYQITQRTVGGFAQRHKARFGHDFVPWLRKVPGYQYILAHLGNTHKDSRGCLLMNSYPFQMGGEWRGKNSKGAYLKFYEVLRQAYAEGREVWIEISREKKPEAVKEPVKVDKPTPEIPLVLTDKAKQFILAENKIRQIFTGIGFKDDPFKINKS